MDYEFFESLTNEDAGLYLVRFLEAEGKSVEQLIQDVREEGISANYSIAVLVPVLSAVYRRIKTVSREPDKSLPDWIRNSASYGANLFDFDDVSKVLILRGAYYMGETFVRSFRRLEWGLGDQDTAVKNMPVVRGFRQKLELAPMLVLENTFGRALSGRGSSSDIQEMVSYWASMATPK